MESVTLDWLGNFINYSIFVYIFLKSIQLGSLNLFDSVISLIGLISSILIFIYTHFINKEEY